MSDRKWLINEDVYLLCWKDISLVALDLERSIEDVKKRLAYLNGNSGKKYRAKLDDINVKLAEFSKSFWELEATGFSVDTYLCGHMRTDHFTNAMIRYGKG